MATGQWAVVLRHVRRLFDGGSVSGLSEGQLLERFASTRDEVAFGALLARHGPMVLGVCRGVLDDPNDVDDAFQATFLVLVKKAGALRDGDRLAQWLYGVARRVALRARSDSSRRKARERPEAEETVDHHATLDAALRELQVLIREEVDRLSNNDRMAVVLCYLEGLTHEEAADRLGWPVGTVKGRLSRARDKLKDRLTRRGVALPAVAIGPALAKGASAAVPPALIRSTTLAATQLTAGKTLTAGIVSAHALTLMEGAIGTMFATKLKIAAAVLVATCAVGVPGVLAFQGPGPLDENGKTPAQIPTPPVNLLKSSALDSAGVLPVAKAVEPATNAARDEEAHLSAEALRIWDELVAKGEASPASDRVYLWARRLVEAKAGPGTPEAERKSALQDYYGRIRNLVGVATRQAKSGTLTAVDVLDAKYHLVEAERWLRMGVVPGLSERPMIANGAVRKAYEEMLGRRLERQLAPADEPRNRAILAKLEEKLSMNFGSDTPLDVVKKYIQESTQDEAAGLPNGIPIYVDPVGLQDADKTMASTVAIRLEGIPLRTTLRLLLEQLDLTYSVKDGLLIITNEVTSFPDPAAEAKKKAPGGFR